ncbi:MAG: Lrp/AsnC family transcriptional regulator [Thermoprotei archaeon]
MELSELDLKILRELQANARISKKALSERLKVSPVTVSVHIDRLVKSGVIERFATIINPDVFGYSIEALIEVSVQGGHIVEVEQTLAKYPNVYAVFDVTGETDVVILARFRTREELSAFVKSMLSDPKVLRTNTRLILMDIKRSLDIPLPEQPTHTGSKRKAQAKEGVEASGR